MPIPQLKLKSPEALPKDQSILESITKTPLLSEPAIGKTVSLGMGAGKKMLLTLLCVFGVAIAAVGILFFTSDRVRVRLVQWFPFFGSDSPDPLKAELAALRFDSLLTGIHSWLLVVQDVQRPRPGGGAAVAVLAFTTRGRAITSLSVHTMPSLAIPANARRFPVPVFYRSWVGSDTFSFSLANVFPDFADSALQYRAQYQQSQKGSTLVDVVIAINSSVLPELLDLFGPLTIESISVTPERVYDILGFDIQENPVLQEIPQERRSVFLEQVFLKLSQRIFSSNPRQVKRLFEILRSKIQEREVQLYGTDPEFLAHAQSLAANGTVISTTGDSLLITEFSRDSKFTNRAITRNVRYAVTEEDRGLVGSLVLTYDHTNYFDWKTGAYQAVARVFLPVFVSEVTIKTITENGIFELLSAIETSSESGKTVVTIPVRVEPKAKRVIVLDYVFSRDRYHEFLFTGKYHFFLQKASGLYPEVTVQFDFKNPITRAFPGGKIINGNYTYTTRLANDVLIELEY